MPARKGSTAKRPAPAKHTSSTTQKRASAQPARARNSVQVQQRPSVRVSPSAGRSGLHRAPSNNAHTTSSSRYSPQHDRRTSEPVTTSYAPRTNASHPPQEITRQQSGTTRQYDNTSRFNSSATNTNNSRLTPSHPQSNNDHRESSSSSGTPENAENACEGAYGPIVTRLSSLSISVRLQPLQLQLWAAHAYA